MGKRFPFSSCCSGQLDSRTQNRRDPEVEREAVVLRTDDLFASRTTYPSKQKGRDGNDAQDPHAGQRELGEPPGEDHLPDAGVAEHEEAAEGDEGEREVVDDGDGPPEDGGHDAHGLAERPAPVDEVQGEHGSGDEAEEEVAERQVQDVERRGVVDALGGNSVGLKNAKSQIDKDTCINCINTASIKKGQKMAQKITPKVA